MHDNTKGFSSYSYFFSVYFKMDVLNLGGEFMGGGYEIWERK